MEYRELGKTGEKVSAIGLGCWAAGGTNWGGTDDVATSEAFQFALDEGANFIDTAPVYGFGHAERVLGKAIEGRRDGCFLATKFGVRLQGDPPTRGYNDLSPDSIRIECDDSLRRLRTDRIDLYQAHWPLPGEVMTQTVTEDMIATLAALRDAGKIRFYGVSNFSVEQLEWCRQGDNAIGGGGVSGTASEFGLASLQPALSILRPGAASELIPWCHRHGVGVVCYSPLFRGLLTGKYTGAESFAEGDSRRDHPDYQGEAFAAICKRVALLGRFAESHGTSIAGVALNWVLSTPGVTVAIAGTRSREQFAGALAGQGWALDGAEYEEIEALFADVAKIF